MTPTITESQTSADRSQRAKGKGLRTFAKFALVKAVILSACSANNAPNAVEASPTPGASTNPETQPANPTVVSNPVQIEATSTPTIQTGLESPLSAAGLYYGSYGVDGGNQPVIAGAISPTDFQSSNPGSEYTVPAYGNGEVQVNTLYSETNSDTPAATMLDQKWLDGYLHASTGKDGVTTGVLPDGTQVVKEGLFWVNAQGEVLNPLVRNSEGESFGWPMLVTKNNQLYFGVVDSDGKLVGGEQFNPAFQSAAQIAAEAGFAGPQNVARVHLTNSGILQMFDTQGKLLGEVKYVGNGKTFEESVNTTTEYSTPTLYDQTLARYATTQGIDAESVELHVEVKQNKNSTPVAFQVDQRGTPLFILDTENGVWREVGYKDISPKDFKVGSSFAVWTGDYDSDPRYKNVFLKNFELVATDGSLSEYDLLGKIPNEAVLTPQQAIDLYDWSDFDKIATFARENNLPLRASHAFVSPVIDNNTPAWMSNMTDDQLREYIQLHVTAVMQRAHFSEASVAAEAFYGAGIPGNQFFYKRLGEDYIRLAFQTARQVSPDTILILNDNIVYGPNGVGSDDGVNTSSVFNGESNAILQFVKKEVAKGDQGIPIDGIGIESHLVASDFVNGDPDANVAKYQQELKGLIAKYNEIGVNVYITELDINMAGLPSEWSTAQQEQFKAKIYAAVYNAALDSENCKGVTTWGFSNTATWMLTSGYPFGEGLSPLPLDDSYQSLASDYAIKQALFNHMDQ
jgi:GH35 family endo-1,4-beta-xylanase